MKEEWSLLTQATEPLPEPRSTTPDSADRLESAAREVWRSARDTGWPVPVIAETVVVVAAALFSSGLGAVFSVGAVDPSGSLLGSDAPVASALLPVPHPPAQPPPSSEGDVEASETPPQPERAPAVMPRPRSPEPEPAGIPLTAAGDALRVVVVDEAGTRTQLPAQLLPGSYRIDAVFGAGAPAPAGRVSIAPGEDEVHIACDSAFLTCGRE